jgi:hypothetical protein
MLTGSTSKMEENDIYRRLEKGGGHGEKEIRVSLSRTSLCVTVVANVVVVLSHSKS